MSFSMRGSGIYSQDVTIEIECNCDECETPCTNIWEHDFTTNDWGYIDAKVTCSLCHHQFDFEQEESARDAYEPDRIDY